MSLPSTLLRLSDSEITTVMAMARPLPAGARGAFLEQVAAHLAGQPAIGDGIVGRVCRDLQKQFFDPPDIGHGNGVSKWDR